MSLVIAYCDVSRLVFRVRLIVSEHVEWCFVMGTIVVGVMASCVVAMVRVVASSGRISGRYKWTT